MSDVIYTGERTIEEIRRGHEELPVVRRVVSADDSMEKFVLDFMPNDPGVILFYGNKGDTDQAWKQIHMLALAFGGEGVTRKTIDATV